MLDEESYISKVQYLYGRLVCRCDRYKQESAMSYPAKSVITCEHYPTKEGNNTLAEPGTGDVNDTDGSRRHSRRNE